MIERSELEKKIKELFPEYKREDISFEDDKYIPSGIYGVSVWLENGNISAEELDKMRVIMYEAEMELFAIDAYNDGQMSIAFIPVKRGDEKL